MKLQDSDAQKIYDWLSNTCQISNLETPEEYHVTLIYDKRNPHYTISDPQEKYAAEISGGALFGEENNVLVLLLNSPDLNARNKEIVDAGYQSDFPDYKPHITVKKDADSNDLQILKNHLKSKLGLTLDNEQWGPTKD